MKVAYMSSLYCRSLFLADLFDFVAMGAAVVVVRARHESYV